MKKYPCLFLFSAPGLCSVGLLLLSAFLLLPSSANAVTLQSAYDAAGPFGIYDKYVVLSKGMTYTGGLDLTGTGATCIRGSGAIIDLQQEVLLVNGKGTRLDIDHCVIMNGGYSGYSEAALHFLGGEGDVLNNTIYGNTIGVRVYSSAPGAVQIINNIIVRNTIAGVLFYYTNRPSIVYNDCWANNYGDYFEDCG